MKTAFKVSSIFVRSVCLLHIVHEFFYEFTETKGESMIPTINARNDYVHVSKRYKNGKNVKLGDCIVAIKPTDPKQRVCKRITGLENDIILVDPSICNSNELKKYNNTTVSDVNYCFNSFIKVPKGHVWLTGDNLNHSIDSRSYNVVSMGLIVGKIYGANDFNKGSWRDLFGFRFIRNTLEREPDE
ncbi:hypothetical protein TBLA_0B05650 [Henningerozyma blattae CBS 6284]|uniref:Mitochondrial inner membrane protease subunit n=1 Tax=Henningerozyma blattae (strain ATCC 34711 / CBS 6284 / DSM 70876 / NBRC 10599 / NRRL Y-10934 / UCD 77-7) TaxID=1071380 RepID=I2GZ40_HENB6|nr:hypothetical protein TBLA_0B05650 [Tetrapisispora blattae CBS 6284]CCH59392.1 hypothetical protein TBLA_0B05650 [Tetrapisispora blattae CBS 6284]